MNGVLITLLIVLAGVLFYANRVLLTSTYDAVYWKDRFEHSQWQLPLSQRTIGDDGLYAYEGYQLMQGTDPTKYNAEIPPLGKYAIGAVIRLTGNSSWYGVISFVLVCILFYILAKKVLKKTTLALAATTWLAFDPLLVSQWTATMLDGLHLASLLLFFILLDNSIILSGIALGIFSSVKYPVFSVILFLAGEYYIWRKTHAVRNFLLFFLAALLTYFASYTKYFLLGHTFVDWLGVQKWMFAFWYNGRLQANIGSVWTTLLVGRYQNLFTKLWVPVPEWSITWPIITILSGCIVLRSIRLKQYRKSSWKHIMGASVLAIVFSYTCISFWTRYLLIVMPFLYLGAAALIRTVKNKTFAAVCILAILLANGSASLHIIFPTPEADVRQFVYDWKNGFFQDMYERFSVKAKESDTRYAFHRAMQRVMRDGEIESVSITDRPTTWKHFANPQYVSLEVTYHTRNLGEFTETVKLPVVKENNQWRIPWQPNYLIPGFSRGDTLKTTVLPANSGTIRDHDGHILAADFPSYMVWITPQNVERPREQEMLTYLEILFGGPPTHSGVNLYHTYSVNSQPDWPAPIGVVPHPVTPEIRNTLLSYPGITLTPALGRETNAAEQPYIGRVYGHNGGTLVIMDNTGKIVRTLISREKKDGEDVSL